MAKDVQVIKTTSAPVKKSNPSDWDDSKKLCGEIDDLSKDIEKTLDALATKYQSLLEKSLAAYKAAPLTDCGYGVSPISSGRMFHAMKTHLMKKNMRLDGGYYGDPSTLTTFTQYIKDATSWLLKFSH